MRDAPCPRRPRAAWPIGDLNLPRAFFTEKAFPENETVLTTSVSTKGDKAIQSWLKGVGDVAFALRRTFLASASSGTVAAAGAEMILPTGNAGQGLGNGDTVFEPFAMWR